MSMIFGSKRRAWLLVGCVAAGCGSEAASMPSTLTRRTTASAAMATCSGTPREQEAMTGQFVERDFLHIPTFEADAGQFVYAVPKGHQENDDDAALRAQAAPVLARYEQLRADAIGDGKPGVLQLVRTWFDDGDGNCSPRHATRGESMLSPESAPMVKSSYPTRRPGRVRWP